MTRAPSFELLRLIALPAGAEVAVLELEGRLRPVAQRSGTTPRAIKPRLLLEDDEGRLDIPAATCSLEGRVLRAAFAVPTARLAGAALAVGVRDLLFDLPAPDTIPGAEREIALAREANALRRELATARGELAEAEEAREAALAEARREEEERLAAAELLIAREREEAAAREAALTEALEAAHRDAAAREAEVRREAEAREAAARQEGEASEVEAHRAADARIAAVEAELDAARREADAREDQARREAAAQVEQVRAEAAAREERLRAELGTRPAPPPTGGRPPAGGEAQTAGRPTAGGGAQTAPPPAAAPRTAAAPQRPEQPTVELGAVTRAPAPGRRSLPPDEPDPPTIRPSTAAARAEPPASRPAPRALRADAGWDEADAPRGGGLFDEPYDPGPDVHASRGPGSGSVAADPDELDEETTAPRPLRRVRRTGEPVPPRGQPATQVRPRAAAPGSGSELPAAGEASVLRYIVLGFVLVALLLVVVAIAAL